MPYEAPITKPIPGLDDYFITDDGHLFNLDGKLILGYISSGYRVYKVKMGLKKRKTVLSHRLVWEAWVGPIPEGYWINHEDGNKLNNSLSNLKCETPSYNHLHASNILKRNYARGDKTATGVLSDEAVEALKDLNKLGYSQHKLSRVFNISQSAISQQLNKLTNGSGNSV